MAGQGGGPGGHLEGDVMMNNPDNPYDYVFTAKECKELMADGWRPMQPAPCQNCDGRGCERCNGVGLLVSLWKNNKFCIANPDISADMVGAVCRMDYTDGKLHLNFVGAGGSAKVSFWHKQLFHLGKFVMDCVCDPRNREEEYGVEGRFRGPPSMALAALTKAGVTVSTIPSKRQKKALKVLRDAGLDEEARLLSSAFEHEVFRGDCEAEEEARRRVGDIEPGTIMQRKGNTVVMMVKADKEF